MKLVITSLICILTSASSVAQRTWTKISDTLILSSPPFKACHASTVLETPQGEILVAFFAGAYEGHKDVSIWLTRKSGDAWSAPLVIANGIISDSLRYPCWNPVLFRSSSGKLFLYYKVGPNPREWWGMVKTSADEGRTWGAAQQLPDGILGPIRNKPIQLRNGTIISPSSTETDKAWKAHMELSKDNGLTWTRVPVDTASPFRVIQPALLRYQDGRIQALLRSDQDKIVQSWSKDGGRTWSPLSTIDLPNPNSGIDAVTLKSGKQLLVYNPTIRGKDWFNGRGKLNVAVSDNGIHWNDIAILENGSTEEYSYPAVIESTNGNVHITYTYDRKNIRYVVLRPGE